MEGLLNEIRATTNTDDMVLGGYAALHARSGEALQPPPLVFEGERDERFWGDVRGQFLVPRPIAVLNAANLSLLAGSRMHASEALAAGTMNYLQGPIFALFVILVAAAEAAVGLALIIALYRLKQTVALDAVGELKG